MRDQIFDKIWELQTKQPTINKFFAFSIEDLRDDPDGCIDAIEEYLERHKDKIESFHFDSWIDEATFTPVLMMRMNPVPAIADHLFPSNLLNCLLPSSREADLLRERITNILGKYAFEFNDEGTRIRVASELGFLFPETEIIDQTNSENVDKGILNFIVRFEDHDYTLEEYLELIASKKRHE